MSETSYESELGPDDLDRVRGETYPDGAAVRYAFSARGLLEEVSGAEDADHPLWSGRVFVEDLRHDEHGQRVSMLVGDARGNQVHNTYAYDVRRRLSELRSELLTGAPHGPLIHNEYRYDRVNNLVAIDDLHTLAETSGWAPVPVSYRYDYDSLYRLIAARPEYATIDRSRPLDDAGTDDDEERIGVQRWIHDELGSMLGWAAEDEEPGEHFYGWSLGTIVNGQQLIQAGSPTGLSPRCSGVSDASARASGPAPHALYFAYEPVATPGEHEAVEACYDASGNMVALFRLSLTGCDDDPLDERSASWRCATSEPEWSLYLEWDEVGRLSRVEKVTADGAGDAVLRNVYDASNSRVLRLDEVSTEGSRQATLYVTADFEIRDAAFIEEDGNYLGGEETKHVFAGSDRIALVVEQTSGDALPWPNQPGEPHAFLTLMNHLGSASVTVNAEPVPGQDDVVVAQTQLPYGADDALVENGAIGWRPGYEYTGKEQDPDVGLVYFGARFYSPGLGRWASPDPMFLHWLPRRDDGGRAQWSFTEISQINGYQYAISSPIAMVDPTGNDIQDFMRGFAEGYVAEALALYSMQRQSTDPIGSMISAASQAGGELAQGRVPMGPAPRLCGEALRSAARVYAEIYRDVPDFRGLSETQMALVLTGRPMTHGTQNVHMPDEAQLDRNMGRLIARLTVQAAVVIATAGAGAASGVGRGAASSTAGTLSEASGPGGGAYTVFYHGAPTASAERVWITAGARRARAETGDEGVRG